MVSIGRAVVKVVIFVVNPTVCRRYACGMPDKTARQGPCRTLRAGLDLDASNILALSNDLPLRYQTA